MESLSQEHHFPSSSQQQQERQADAQENPPRRAAQENPQENPPRRAASLTPSLFKRIPSLRPHDFCLDSLLKPPWLDFSLLPFLHHRHHHHHLQHVCDLCPHEYAHHSQQLHDHHHHKLPSTMHNKPPWWTHDFHCHCHHHCSHHNLNNDRFNAATEDDPWPSSLHHHHLHDHQRHHNHDDTSPPLQDQQQEGELGSCRDGAGLHDHHNDEHLLRTLCEKGQLDRALNMLFHLDTVPSSNTYLCLLQACNKSKSTFAQAKKIHAHLAQHNAPMTTLLGDYLAMTLAKCGAIDEACQISDRLPRRTVFSWTAIISAYTDCGRGQEALRMHQRMQEDGVEPNSYTFVSLFKACGSTLDLKLGKKLHAEARSRGLASHVFVGSTLVSMYGKCGAVAEAEDVFCALPRRDPVSWNAMLTAYVEQGQGEKALHLYRQMQKEDVITNRNTFVFALQACGTLAEKEDAAVVDGRSTKVIPLKIGQALHADVHRKGLVFDIMVGSALVSMYGKCGSIFEADNVFSALFQRDVVSWNAMLTAYVDQGEEEKALHLYRQMQEDGMSPDQPTFVIALRACGTLAEKETLIVKEQSNKVISLEFGEALHADARRLGYASDAQVANTLVSMYGKCGAVVEAEDVFGALSQRDVVSWTVLLCTYVEHGHGEKALQLYREMQIQHVTKDDVALVSMMQACGGTGNLETCRQLHFEVVSAGYDHVTAITSTLVIAYRSCASMVDAQACFDGLFEASIVLWNACMAGHAGKGNCVASLGMFENMKAAAIKPDELTFISALSACRHAGLVVTSLEYFESMSRDYGLSPNTKHYGILLDLLGRVGNFKRVTNILKRMPMQADEAIWLCLLGACGTHGNLELAKQAFDHAVNLEPKHAGAYVLLSNIYADAGLQDCADEVENFRQIQGAVDCE